MIISSSIGSILLVVRPSKHYRSYHNLSILASRDITRIEFENRNIVIGLIAVHWSLPIAPHLISSHLTPYRPSRAIYILLHLI